LIFTHFYSNSQSWSFSYHFLVLPKIIMPEFIVRIIDFISQPWPWYVAGPMISLIVFTLLFLGKEFGISGNLRAMCAADGAGRFADFFDYDWQKEGWNLMIVLGAMFGGYIASHYFMGPEGNLAHISGKTVQTLNELGFENLKEGAVPLVPDFYSWNSLFNWRGLLIIVGGGFMVGFGARYGGGCTSGHAISGLSELQIPSLVAVIGFFMGGLIMTHLIFPLIF
jgi:uncharacterized protein